jgi:hypothetical protein
VLLMGDWSARMKEYHEPIRGKGIRDALRQRGFEIHLFDEVRTSKVCPSCLQPSLKKFKRVTNPRTWRRDEYPMVTCHGLLRCNNQECMQTVEGNHRYWNRDLASVLNYRHIILNGLKANGLRPPEFQKPRFQQRNILFFRNGYRHPLLTMPVSKISKYRRKLNDLPMRIRSSCNANYFRNSGTKQTLHHILRLGFFICHRSSNRRCKPYQHRAE